MRLVFNEIEPFEPVDLNLRAEPFHVLHIGLKTALVLDFEAVYVPRSVLDHLVSNELPEGIELLLLLYGLPVWKIRGKRRPIRDIGNYRGLSHPASTYRHPVHARWWTNPS